MPAADAPSPRALWAAVDAPRPAPSQAPALAAERSTGLDLERTFSEHYAAVWRLLRRFGVPHAQLDDAAQEVFWVFARRLSDVRAGSERAFLYGVALRIAADHARRRLAAPAIEDVQDLSRIVDPCPSPEQCLEQRQARAMLDVVLDGLSLELRAVFVLAELEELEMREIAELEGIPIGTASSRLRRARAEFAAIVKRLHARLAASGVKL
jgi:RNA polymerase sigma-70 factor, ECF subfamily